MTKFESIGVNIQHSAYRKDWAVKQMNNSCYYCVLRNMNIKCERCMIAEAHKQVMEELTQRDLEMIHNLKKDQEVA